MEHFNQYKFRPLSRVQASFAIVAQITNAIASGELLPGSRLPTELELSAQLAVGRNTLREAVKVLEALGLVVIRRGDGTYIQDTCSYDLLAPLFLRLIWVEPDRKELLDFLLAVRHPLYCMSWEHPEKEKMDRFLSAGMDLEAACLTCSSGDPAAVDRILNLSSSYQSAKAECLPPRILSQLIELPLSIFHRCFAPFDREQAAAWNWSLEAAALAAERRAVCEPSSASRSDALDARLLSWQSQMEQLGTVFPAPSSHEVTLWLKKRRSASKQIFLQLVFDLVNRRYAPGEFLPTEQELIERFDVSRNVVREAVKSLEALGLVEIRRPAGTRVSEENSALPPFINPVAYARIIAHQDTDVFLQLKICIRDAVFYLACRNAGDLQRKTFLQLTKGFTDELRRPYPDMETCGHRLSTLNGYLLEICGNPILQKIEGSIAEIAAESRFLFLGNALRNGRQGEVIHSYERDADILMMHRMEEIGDAMKEKLDLWTSLEIGG